MKTSRLFVAALLLLALFAGGLWLKHHSRAVAMAPAAPAASSQTPARSSVPTPVVPAQPPSPATNPAPLSATATKAAFVATAGASIDDLLSNPNLDDKAVLTGLSTITLDTSRSLAERTEALSHLLNLSAGDPAVTLLPLVTDARLPDALCTRILDDALNAPPAWQADACLAVLAKRKDHELQTKAHEHLVFLVGTDHGDNLAGWAKSIALSKKTWMEGS